jgi:hypothetical protein
LRRDITIPYETYMCLSLALYKSILVYKDIIWEVSDLIAF